MYMYEPLKLVKIDYKYCDFLRKFDDKVSFNAGKKELRPFVGALIQVNDIKFFAPLSSPKRKFFNMKDTIDFQLINNGEYGAINFNNMISVIPGVYDVIDFNKKVDSVSDRKYQKLLIKQYHWLNNRSDFIRKKIFRLYFYIVQVR